MAPYDGTAYLRQQVNAMRALLPAIDPHRIYIEGLSNGGFMAVYALTEAPDLFAAGGEIESVLDLPAATPVPVRVKHIHALGDTVVPIAGGDSALLAAACGHPMDLPSTYDESTTLPPQSVVSLTTDAGSGPGLHDYQPSAAATLWAFMRTYRR